MEFANEYERLKNEMLKAENEAQSNMNKRRGIAAEKKEARLEREEAEKYQQLKEELVGVVYYHFGQYTKMQSRAIHLSVEQAMCAHAHGTLRSGKTDQAHRGRARRQTG